MAGRLLAASQALVRTSNKLRKEGPEACTLTLVDSLVYAKKDIEDVLNWMIYASHTGG